MTYELRILNFEFDNTIEFYIFKYYCIEQIV